MKKPQLASIISRVDKSARFGDYIVKKATIKRMSMITKTALLPALALTFCAAAAAQERSIETCSEGEPTTAFGLPDADADGVPDATDNCLDVANATQRDSNADGFGNACDADLNDDNVVNIIDLALLKLMFFDADAPDADLDGDGIVALADLAILSDSFFASPGPTGPCLRDAESCSGPKHFEVNDQSTAAGSNLFVIRTQDPATIYHAGRLLDGASQCNEAIAGYTFFGQQAWNPQWEFHIAGDIYFHGDSINAPTGCNRTAGFVQANLGQWCNIDTRAAVCQFWCPWTSALTRVVPVDEISK